METQNHQYFENMFKKIDKNIKLDQNQINIIESESENLMVIAGAGSGKTTTISAKVNYLIDKKNIKAEEILIISFTNKAVDELKDRINKDFHHQTKIVTFHKLGYEIINSNSTRKFSIMTDNKKIIKNYIEKEIILDKKNLKKFVSMFNLYFDNKNLLEYKKETIKNISTNQKLEKIKKYLTNNNLTEKLAYIFYIHDIAYEYQKPYPYDKNYKPDYTITHNNKIYYIEHFQISKLKKMNYSFQIKKIKSIHNKHKTNLIVLYNDNIEDELNKKLQINKSVNIIKLKEIFNKVISQENETSYKKFIELCSRYINLLKSKNYDIKKLSYKEPRNQMFKDFIEKLYIYYQKYIEQNNLLDYDDMINKATKIIKENENAQFNYKYIIIDEYQDISECRYNLIEQLKEKFHPKIMVVGDDWQCIYSFASSNINLFKKFINQSKNCEIKKIETTYRNSQELIDIAGKFINKNPYQIKKNLISSKHNDFPIKIVKYKEMTTSFIKVINYLINKYGKGQKILVLGRYTFDIKKIKSNQKITVTDEKIIYKTISNIQITYMTIHNSKGLGYDNVIVINNIDGELGFPSKKKEDALLKPFMTKEKKKYAEERRLFYVALTRTKNETILLAPKDNPSEFIKEIKKYPHVQLTSNIK